jgi:CRISPR-associated protein Csy1
MNESTGRSAAIRAVIAQFLKERCDAKLEKLKADDPQRDVAAQELRAQYEHSNWLGDAARRAGQIQAVTHSLKPTHPDAKGTNLYCPPASLSPLNVVGSHCLGDDFAGDVVGNAAALDVYKFLKLEHEGQSLLALMLAGDTDVAAALSEQPEQAAEWVDAFTGLVQARGRVASHTLAKQVYWLVGEDPVNDAGFHLLAPLYATSLAHRVHATIQEDRFSEAAKEARQARRDKQFHERSTHDYLNLAVQKLGGTKPQNVSQLNSERGGNNYLLASLPPVWQVRDLAPLLHSDSLFKRFERQEGVWQALKALRDYLEANPPKTMDTRDTRDELAFELIAHFVLFGAAFRTLPEGWSADSECRLHASEKVWVDAGAAVERPSDWTDQLARRYANWLNGQLSSKQRLHMGDPQHQHWQVDLAEELAAYEWEMSHAE